MKEKDPNNKPAPQETPGEKVKVVADIFPGTDHVVHIEVPGDIYHRLKEILSEKLQMEPISIKHGVIFVAAAAATTALVAGGLKYKRAMDRKKEEEQKSIELSDLQKQEFTRLTDLNYLKLYRYINFKLNGNTHEAEDLTQEVLVKAYNNFGRFIPKKDLENPFYSWIFRIANNSIKNWYRGQSVKKKHIEPLDSKFEEISKETITTIYNPSIPLQRRVEINEEVMRLIQQVKGLTDPEKLIVYLETFENKLTNRDLAEIMGRSEQAIKNLKHRVFNKLKK